MKLLLENWRQYLSENAIRGTVPWTQEQLNSIVKFMIQNDEAVKK